MTSNQTSPVNYKKYPVPRIRHHARPHVYLPLSTHRAELSYYPPLIETQNWQELFTDGKPPAMLDVGCGMGHFLIEFALNNPEKNIFGLEVRKSAVEWIDGVIKAENIGNASAIWFSVVNGLPFVEAESIEKIFYFFPDPWVKKRHYKRRAFTPALLEEFARMLKPDGTLYLMTDVPEVDEYQQEILRENGIFDFQYVENEELWDIDVRTNQEKFCLKKSIPYIRIKAVKKK